MNYQALGNKVDELGGPKPGSDEPESSWRMLLSADR